MTQIKIGGTIGKYKIIELLGRGGMAEVYKGYQENLDRYVAIKVMHAFMANDKSFLGRFKREARAMAALSHPNIVGVYDFDVAGDSPYIVMEYVSDGTLKEQLETHANQNRRLPLSRTVRTILEISDALAYAHSRGMVHRDIKPANILVSDTGKAILVDFGIAKMMSGPQHTATGSMIGTPAYMSPEQGLGNPGDHRSDIYALGVLFFQLVAGRMPYEADTPLAIVLKHVNDPIPTPTLVHQSVPEPIQRVIVKAMAKDPAKRYQSATEFSRGIRQALNQIGDAAVLGAVPAELLRDNPTPTPVRPLNQTPLPQGHDSTVDVSMANATFAAGQAAGRDDATQIARPSVDRTEVMVAPPSKRPAAAPPAKEKSRLSPILIGFIALLILGGIVAAGVVFLGPLLDGGDDDPIVAVSSDTPTPTSEDEIEEDGEDSPTLPALNAATINAQLTATADAIPTNTPISAAVVPTDSPTPRPTFSPTPSSTPDLTATANAACNYDISFVQHYTFNNRSFRNVFVDAGTFPLSFVFENNGDCDVPAGSILTFVDGTSFDAIESITLEDPLIVDNELVVTLDATISTSPGEYASTWQLVGPDGAPFELTFSFTVAGLERATATSTPPPAAATDTPTPESVEALNFIEEYFTCEYVGGNAADYRCQLNITPYGGDGGPYTVVIVDQNPPSQQNNVTGTVIHFIQSRRCSAWINEVRVIDASNNIHSRNLYFGPEQHPDLFPGGGCTEN